VSRSSPSAPGYLQGAIRTVERVLRESYPTPLTAREISRILTDRGYEWPLRARYAGGRAAPEYGPPTTERVRRVCEMTGNRTRISSPGHNARPRTYSIYEWAL
jgi:hypothetical protein